jgi:hypothetical protein
MWRPCTLKTTYISSCSNSWIVVIAGGWLEVKQKPNLINYLPHLWEWNSFIHSNICLYETFMNFPDWGELCISSQNQRRDLVGEVVACTGEHISYLYIPEMCCTMQYVSYLHSIVYVKRVTRLLTDSRHTYFSCCTLFQYYIYSSIVGICIGALIGLAGLVVMVYLCCRSEYNN